VKASVRLDAHEISYSGSIGAVGAGFVSRDELAESLNLHASRRMRLSEFCAKEFISAAGSAVPTEPLDG
jgi:hypothetical protein